MASEAVYRMEMAKTGRSGCQNSKCKNEGVKIEKGEFRFGTQAFINGHFTWVWKHWGCVTPLQIANLQSQVGPLEDFDDADLSAILDGYDEISPEAQEKVKYGLQNGHVADEDWKGDPGFNRPGMKGINKRTPKKKAVDTEEEGEKEAAEATETPTKPKAKKSRAKKVKAESDEENDIPVSPPPKKTTGRKRKAAAEAEDEPTEKPKRKSRAKKVKAEVQDDIESDAPLNAAPEEPAKKRGRPKKVKQEEMAEDDEAPIAPKTKATKSKAKKVKAEPELEAVKMEEEDDGMGEMLAEPVADDVKKEDAEDEIEPPKKKRGGKAKGKK
ncbi:hypothetical protein LTR47_007887 [Exophiala xenobiotica]|nr:hypothetical protein LTR47_007887 [Exophiala xenobiotica]KAK5248027.1 hypothetical protein LTS06_006895 [Exophiala xenobiotica]KAK5261092.1 hypothetical protein LTR40_002889 [Exophiala xenobiotica]KAK5352637.1 hypothetical protein LTR61_003763 [Exophiala xenobiotica]KAK5370234.1 hypothetical protein LTS13_006824 [Exophiala xenobiotica]